MDATLQDPLVGRLLDGRYLVESRIARGGMATVYLALDRRLDREIALKVMYPHLADDDEFVARFIREARSAARLSHPNVVQVFDQGADGELLYLAMEYLPGRTLRDVLADRGVLTPREALTVLEPVLDALAAAHRAGIVHRDIKPENVVLTDEGRVKVADFGLARAATGATQTGALIGTVGYLSPELVARGIADARSDVYAAGIMFFEMLTGRQPFTGEVAMQVAYRHVHEDVPAPSALVPGLPTELDDVVLAATARDPDERPRDAAEWLRLVRRVHGELDDTVLDHRPAPPSPAAARAERAAGGPDGADSGNAASQADASQAGTQVVQPAIDGAANGSGQYQPAHQYQPTQTLPPMGALERLRERSQREARDQRESHRDVRAPEDDELRELLRRRRKRGLISLISVFVVVVALAVAGWRIAGPGAYTSTPDLTNASESAALALLQQQGLTGTPAAGGYSETVPVGSVISTDPAAGRQVHKGGSVAYTLSLGTAKRTVPTVANLSVAQATAALTRAGLKASTSGQEYSNDVAEGDVISSTPSSGQDASVGDTVSLVVSKGAQPVRVVDVTGRSKQDALDLLTALNLQVDSGTEEYNNDIAEGAVIRQDPAGGKTVAQGSTVTVVISKGPQVVPVPDVVGKQFQEARDLLRAQGFQVRRSNVLGGFFGTVRSQDPGPDQQVPKGTTITLTVV